MSLIEGGNYKCNIHPDDNIDTDDPEVWNEHCRNTEGHPDNISHKCSKCGIDMDFNIPYQNIRDGKTKDIALKCINCFNEGQNLNKLALDNIVINNTNGGEQQ